MTIASSAAALDLARPGIDISARGGERGILLAHVVDQRAAAALAFRHHHLDAEPRQQRERSLR